jgi:plastocyanin
VGADRVARARPAPPGLPRRRGGRAGGDRDHRGARDRGCVDGRAHVGHVREDGAGRKRGSDANVSDEWRSGTIYDRCDSDYVYSELVFYSGRAYYGNVAHGDAPPSSPAAGATTALKLAAEPGGQLSYDTKQLTAKAGKVTITMTNMSPIEHDVAVAQGSKVLGVTPTFQGGSRTLTLSLKPGTYTFYCTVPGHRQAGMEGTLTVSS